MSKIKNLIKILLPGGLLNALKELENKYLDGYAVKCYSQEGEDMILNRIFEGRKSGFYVDVGAHHPFRFSNTYFFYKRGWRGINIDAMPGSMQLFRKFRSKDINLEIPVGRTEDVLTYYSFNEPALNSFSEKISRERNGRNGHFIREEIKLKTSRLSSILDEYLTDKSEIDFLSIDVEGMDFDILKSNDWIKYKPKCILIEVLAGACSDVEASEISLFLRDFGYCVFAKTANTVFFLKRS